MQLYKHENVLIVTVAFLSFLKLHCAAFIILKKDKKHGLLQKQQKMSQ